MTVSVYSREAIESIIDDGKFPKNTAVISFCDPALKHIDKDYSRVDYGDACNDVFYCEVDDLDLDYLPEKGYTYDSFFPEAPDLAEYIHKAYRDGKDIICQCEYGQSRSAGCAAAILEHFYRRGIDIFADYKYYPNQVVYHKLFDALEKYKHYHDNRYYYAADAETIRTHIAKLQLPETLLDGYSHENGDSAVDLKCELEKALSERSMLYHTAEEIINALLNKKQPVYASFTVTKPVCVLDRYYFWDAYAVCTYFKYGFEVIPVEIWFNKYRSSSGNMVCKRTVYTSNNTFGVKPIRSLSFFGKLSWDSKRKMIDAVPVIITNIQS